MKVMSLEIVKFKGLNNFFLEFDGYVDLKKYFLTLIVGENATYKTTILQALLEGISGDIRSQGTYSIKLCQRNIDDVIVINVKDGNRTIQGDSSKLNAWAFSFSFIDKLQNDYSNSFVGRDVRAINNFSNNLFEKVVNSYEISKIEKVFSQLNINISKIFFQLGVGRRNKVYKVFIKDIKEVYELTNRLYDYIYSDDTYRHSQRRKNEEFRIYLINNKNSFEYVSYDCDKGDFYDRGRFKESTVELDDWDLNIDSHNLDILIKKLQIIQENFHQRVEFYIYKSKKIIMNFQNVLETVDGYLKDLMRLYHLVFNISLIQNVYVDVGDVDLIPIREFSSGELSFIIRFLDLIDKVKDNTIILIDEPEVHFHPQWIKSYLSTLDKLFSEEQCHFIITTHSPLLVTNVEKSNLIAIKREGKSVIQLQESINPFAKDMDDILLEVFQTEPTNTGIINDYLKKITCLLENAKTRREGINMYNKLEKSKEKFKLYLEYSEEIEGKKND